MKRAVTIYIASMIVFVLGVAAILHLGKDLSDGATAGSGLMSALRAMIEPLDIASLWKAFAQNFKDPLARLLLQFIVVILVTRAVGRLFSWLGHPAVVGEIAAGILLGPSLFGWAWPQGFSFVFPAEGLGVLQLFSELGVCVFMFVVGMELDVGQLRQKAQMAVAVSQASIIAPYLLGVGSAVLLFPLYAANGTSFVSFALLMGIAMAITAFPVLARILTDRNMAKTELGATALTCAAVGDATAWALLAFIVALARANGIAASFISLVLVILFVALMMGVVRPLLARFLAAARPEALTSRGFIALVLIFLTGSALATHLMGIHALFGAFLGGVVMPRKQEFLNLLIVRLESFSFIFLLPLFFAFSGLRTQIGLLDAAIDWLVCFGIVVVATLGKIGGSMLPARLAGMRWSDAFALGALMNTRGLVELVALNIGYDLGILPPRIFAMMVLMALATTLMTGPLLNIAERLRMRATVPVDAR